MRALTLCALALILWATPSAGTSTADQGATVTTAREWERWDFNPNGDGSMVLSAGDSHRSAP